MDVDVDKERAEELQSKLQDLDVTISTINQGNIYRYILKPWNTDDMASAIESALERYHLRENNRMLVDELKQKNALLSSMKEQLEEENKYLQEEIRVHTGMENIVSQNQSFLQVLRQIEQVAETRATVLIHGETGTGKELVARAVHSISNRSDKPFIKLNCAAIPDSLMESELFGYRKGAFTGANEDRKGKFERAHKGTIFLDEIGELPLELQSKLLRVLQEGSIEKIGEDSPIQVDVRIIAATNRDLQAEVKAGNFRSDLFYRLNVFPIAVPPLRERRDDIPLLVKHFIDKHNQELGKNIQSVPKKTMDLLMKHPWSGNIRELENMVERAMILSSGTRLELNPAMLGDHPEEEPLQIRTLDEVMRNHIVRTLESTGHISVILIIVKCR